MAKSERGRSLSGNPYRAIWGELRVQDWDAILKDLSADSQFTIRGESLFGRCPYPHHNDTAPSFWVHPKKGYAKCYGCNRFESNPVRFLAEIGGFSWKESATYLRSKYAISSLSPKLTKDLEEREALERVRKVLFQVCRDILLSALQDYLLKTTGSVYEFAYPALAYLETRGIPLVKGLLKALPVGVVPPLRLMTQAVGPDVSQHCYAYLKSYMTASYMGALIFAYNDSPNTIGGFKLRADFLRQDGSRDIVYVKNPDGAPIGVFGLKFYSALVQGKKPAKEALVMEGEFDVLTNMVHQLIDKRPYDVVLGTGGNSDVCLGDLEEFGFERLLLVPDSMDHGGETVAREWLKTTKMPSRVFCWPSNILAKDPDDAIKVHGWTAWLAVLTEKVPGGAYRTHFKLPHEWAASRLQARLVDADFEDVRALKSVAADVGSCLVDPSEQKAYIDFAVRHTGLANADLIALIIGGEDSEEGFMQRIRFALQQSYTFLGAEDTAGGIKITFWHRKKRTLRTALVARPADLFSTLSADLGTFVDWTRNNVGVPDWVAYKTVGGASAAVVGTKYLDQEKTIKQYAELALTGMLTSLPDMKDLKELKAGCHYIDVVYEKTTEKRWVVVNGNDVFLGIPEGTTLAWRRLDGPQLGAYVFNMHRQPWSKELTCLEDLNAGLTCDINAAYTFICRVLSAGWRFKHQQEDVEYLAAAMMLNTVCSSLPRQLYTMINGPRGSGKSTLLGLLSGSNPATRLLEAAFTMDSYTVAGFRKEMNNCSLGAVLDEFEDQGGDSHSRSVRDILRDIRGLTSNPEARILRGNVESQEATEYVLRCQIWTAAIQYLREEADVSRFIQIKTDVVEGHPNPKTTMENLFTVEEFKEARRAMTLGLFRHVPALLSEVKNLRNVYSRPESMQALSDWAGVVVPSRYLDGVIIPAALMSLLGRDPHEFIARFIKAKADMLKQVVNTTHEASLLDHILSAQLQYTKPGSETRHTNVRALLSNSEERAFLNETESGVYYLNFPDPASSSIIHWLIIIWADALHGVLKNVPQFRGETPSRLKQLAEAGASMVVKSRDLTLVPGGLRRHLKVGVKSTDFTVFDLTSTLYEWDSDGDLIA